MRGFPIQTREEQEAGFEAYVARMEEELALPWVRAPEHDKRIRHGDDFAGDAWRNKETGEIHHVAVGHIPSFARDQKDETDLFVYEP